MRLVTAVLVLCAFLLTGAVSAADALRLDVVSIDEQAGKLNLTLTAYGMDGKPLADLTPNNFRASIGQTPLSVASVQTAAAGRTPASVLLLVDVSGSMQGEPLNQAKAAIQDFSRGLDPGDQMAIVAFDTKPAVLQDFTSDRGLIDGAIGRLVAQGDTALYDAVVEAAQRIARASTSRRLIVLLSDGEATTNLDRRQASLNAARSAGVPVVSVGLGAAIDRQYLVDLAGASGGRLLEAPTPASLLQAYNSLATELRSQYTLTLNVPTSLNRGVPDTLLLRLTRGSDSVEAQQALSPFSGAAPQSFDIKLEGVQAGVKLKDPVVLSPAPPTGTVLISAQYSVDGNVIGTRTSEPFSYNFDPATLAAGAHVVKLSALDNLGRRGETTVAVTSVAAAKPSAGSGSGFKFPTLLLYLAGLVALGGASLQLLVRQRSSRGATAVESRMKPWAGLRSLPLAEPSQLVEGWPEPAALVPPKPLPATDTPLGLVVLMDEEAIKSGRLDSIREWQIGTTPLTLGSSLSCDIQIQDEEGRIAPEEARLWVQRGCLVYHKLTTLSAMATEGVTSGWQIIEDDEDMAVGPYQLLFRANPPAQPEEEPEQQPQAEPAEQKSYFSELWSHLPEDPAVGLTSE